jgi:hypothetical protein
MTGTNLEALQLISRLNALGYAVIAVHMEDVKQSVSLLNHGGISGPTLVASAAMIVAHAANMSRQMIEQATANAPSCADAIGLFFSAQVREYEQCVDIHSRSQPS